MHELFELIILGSLATVVACCAVGCLILLISIIAEVIRHGGDL